MPVAPLCPEACDRRNGFSLSVPAYLRQALAMFRVLCPELAGHIGYDGEGEAECVATLAEAERIATDESRNGAVLVQIVEVATGEVVREIPQDARAARPGRARNRR